MGTETQVLFELSDSGEGGWTVFQIAETYLHVVGGGEGEGDGYADSEDDVGHAEGVEATVAEEKQAGGESPEQSDGGEDGAGKMGDGEQAGGGDHSHFYLGHDSKQAQEEEIEEEELLQEGPDGVSPVTPDEQCGGGGDVGGVKSLGQSDGDGGEQHGEGDDPEGTQKAATVEAHGAGAIEGDDSYGGDPGEGGPEEDSLAGLGSPDDKQDETVSDGKLKEVAPGGTGDGHGGRLAAGFRVDGLHEGHSALLHEVAMTVRLRWFSDGGQEVVTQKHSAGLRDG